MIIEYGTTVDQMLTKYLKTINKRELYANEEKIKFVYNSKEINFGENTPIEKYFSITDNIIIKVFYLCKVMNG